MQRFDQSPTDPDFVQNPYPLYDRMREAGDLVYWTDYDIVCATSHKAVTTILKDRRFGREAPAEFARAVPDHLRPFYDIEANSMLELEPPRHTKLRSLVMRAFTSRGISSLGPMISELANDLIDQFADGPFDIIDAFARPIPVIVICRLLGVPEDRASDLLRWSNDMVAMYQARRTPAIEAAAVAATLEFRAFLSDYIVARRKAPKSDLLSELIAAEAEGEKLTSDELIATVMVLLNAGHEATVHTLGNGIKALIENGKPDVTPATAEEILRFDPPLHIFLRWVYEDVTLFGHDFKRGDEVGCLLASANRDPAAYPDPNTFQADRSGPVNASFGGGIHFCVGAPLARMEIHLALDALFTRRPDLRMTEPATYADLYHFHGLDRLMVTTAAQASI